MKILLIILLLTTLAFFAHAKLKPEPSAIECSVAYMYYDGDVLVSYLHRDLVKEEYKTANNNKVLSRRKLAVITMLETLEFQSKNTLLKLSNFLSCESDVTKLGNRVSKIKRD
jgi:hypothetical protein